MSTTLRLELFVSDVERSASFYQRALGFEREQESAGYIAVRRGEVRLGIGLASALPAMHPLRPRSGERVGVGVEVVIEVNDVDSAYALVQGIGHPLAAPRQERPWGSRDFRVVDPDGYYLRITSTE